MMYDLLVIGGGPAGYSAALHAADRGLRVIVFESGQMGGTCLNRGCIPTKFFVHAAECYDGIGKMQRYGISVGQASVNYQRMCDQRDAVVSQLRSGLIQKMEQKKIEIRQAAAQVVDKNTVCSAGEKYLAENILVATGSVPVDPFLKNAISSDGLLKLDRIPRSLKIIGGGIVAVEFAHIFRLLGVDVTLCLRSGRILRTWDRELALGLSQNMKKRGIRILPNLTPEQMEAEEAELTLSATGRVPMYQGVFSEQMAIAAEEGIITDEYGRTNIEGIYAAGDVIQDSPQLAHVAMEQGRRVVDYILGDALPEPATVVRCIYVSPEIASVGLTEAEAKDRNIPVITGKQTMYANARTMIATEERGFIKLVAERETGKLIGAQLFCERAGDIAGELALAVNAHLTVRDIIHSVHPHPSYCEEIAAAASVIGEKMK